MSRNAGRVNCNVFTIVAMAAKQWLQIKPLCYFSTRMSVILISSIGSFKSFYCCFRSFFCSVPGLLDMHGAWRLDESFGSGSARWHWSHVPPCECPLSGWALLPGSLNRGQHISHSSCLAHPPSFAAFRTPASPFNTLCFTSVSYRLPPPKANVCDVAQECGSLGYSVLQNNLNGTKTPAILHNLSLAHPFYFSLSPTVP